MFKDSVAPAGAWFVLTFYPQLKLRAIIGRRSATWLCGSAALFTIPHFAFSLNGQQLGYRHGTFAKGD
jgi:hypothetical protein